jgi:hypothetical protein
VSEAQAAALAGSDADSGAACAGAGAALLASGRACESLGAAAFGADARFAAAFDSALGARLVSRAADRTRLRDRLERLGLVQRRRNDRNRRAVEVSITPAGVALVGRLAGAVRRCGREQLGHLDRRSLRQLVELLARARAPHEAGGAAAAWPVRTPTPGRRPPR